MNYLRTLLSAFIISACLPAMGENVSQKQASKIAETFFNAAYGEYVASPKLHWNGRQLTNNRLFAPFYIYNHPKGGFVIVAADSKAFPILGYGLNGPFNKDAIGEEERNLLTQYAREIELVRYDSRIPVRAMEAWQKMPEAIYEFLNTPYSTPEFAALTHEMQERIEVIDRRNGWIMIPSAVEFPIYDPERFREYTLNDVLAEEPEDVPFALYYSFIAELQNEERLKAAALDEIINPTRPVVKNLGGAHSSIRFPENINLIRVFSMDGSRKIERYYSKSNEVNLDLSSLSQGFYAVLAVSDSGTVYGVKLAR